MATREKDRQPGRLRMVDCAATKDRVCPRQNSAILLVEGYIWLHILCRRVWAVVEKVMVKGWMDGWMDGWMFFGAMRDVLGGFIFTLVAAVQ